MASRKEYELAIKIAGRVESSLKNATNLSRAELNSIARSAVTANMSMKQQFASGFADMDKGFEKVSGVAKKTFDVVAKAATIGAVAIGGVVAASVKVGTEFEAQMSTVSAISGSTGNEMDQLRNKAEEMGRTTVFTATEAGKAMEYMAMAGWKTSDMLSGIDGIMNLAAASGEELGTVSDIVTDDLTAFGLGADQAGRFADVLAAAASNSNTNVSMMGETFKYAAPIAGALGYTIEDTALAVGLLANSGIKGSQAGTSLRKMFNSLTGTVKLAGDSFGEIDIAAANADGSMRPLVDVMGDLRECFGQMTEQEQAQNAKAIFGERAMAGMLAIINSSETDWNKLAGAIENSAGAAERMADVRLDNLQGDVTLAKSALEGTGLTIYEELQEPLRGAVQLFTGWITKVNDWAVGGGIQRIIDPIKKAVPDIKRVLTEGGKAMMTFAKPLLDLGAWFIKNPKVISSALIGIGSAMLTYKIASTAYHVADGISAIAGAMSNPVTGVVVASTLAVGAVMAFGAYMKQLEHERATKSLSEHFGDISLSIEELQEAARHIIDNGQLDKLDTAMSELGKNSSWNNSIKNAVSELNKYNWKVSVGMELDETERQQYMDDITQYISDCNAQLEQERYSVQLNMSLFSEDDGLIGRVDAFYANNQTAMTSLGQELAALVNKAFEDDYLSVDEADQIAKVQQKMADLQAAMADAASKSQYDIWQHQYGGQNLTGESFKNLMAEEQKQIEENTAKYQESLQYALQAARAADEAQGWSETAIQSDLDAIYNEYQNKIDSLQTNAQNFNLQTIFGAYQDELPGAISEFQKTMDKTMANTFADTGAWADATSAFDKVQSYWFANLNGSGNLDAETSAAVKELWAQMQPNQEDLLATAQAYKDAGHAIPPAILAGIKEGAKVGAQAGDEASIYYLMGDAIANSDDYAAIMQQIKDSGYQMPQEVLNGIEDGRGAADYDSVAEGIYNDTVDAINGVFKSPVDVIPNINIPNVNVLSTKGLEEAKQKIKANIESSAPIGGIQSSLKHYASGGIISSPTLATFAEEGPEAAIPLDGSSRAMSLWKQAGDILGMKSSAERGVDALAQSGSSSSGTVINFSPVQNFNGGAPSREDILDANRTSMAEFEAMMAKYLKDNGRLSFA